MYGQQIQEAGMECRGLQLVATLGLLVTKLANATAKEPTELV